MDQPLSALQKHFGYPSFRKGQQQIVASVMAGRDVLAVLPTGGGKSICYQIPALLLPRVTVVISPLISLMQDQVAALTRRGLGAGFINSTLSQREIGERLDLVASGALKLLYLAPERFEFGGAARRLRAAGVSLLAVDEAHCVSEWGHDFRPSYTRIHLLREEIGSPPAIALTATATPRVQREIVSLLRLRDADIHISGFDRPNLDYHVTPVRNSAARDRKMIDLLRQRSDTVIVYSPTRRAVERISVLLRRQGLRADAYHAGLHQRRRESVQNAFMSGATRVIVATNAFGMGIDKPDVRMVIHHGMPGTLEAYYQEAGRAGRDGKRAMCVLLHHYADRRIHDFFIRMRVPEPRAITRVLAAALDARDRIGFIPAAWPKSADVLRLNIPFAELRACMDLFVARGILTTLAASESRMAVRLLATPRRIVRSLHVTGARLELEALRSLWRAAGEQLKSGATIHIASLAPVFQDARLLRTLLTRLQDEQLVLVRPVGAGWHLSPDINLASAMNRMNWAFLERRRATEVSKLHSMQQYALTSSCRRAFLLRYFGDERTAGNCGKCDNCLDRPNRHQLSDSISRRKADSPQRRLNLHTPADGTR